MGYIILSGASRWALVGLVALLLAGCAGAVPTLVYYTWSCPSSACPTLAADHPACVTEANRGYVPWVAGPGPRQGFYKSCMEARGYQKAAESATRPAERPAPGTGLTWLNWGAR